MSVQDMNPMEEWLSEYSNKTTQKIHRARFEGFLKWVKKTPQELVAEFDNKKVRSMILQFQSYLLNERKYAPNSSKAIITTVRAFYSSQCQQISGLRGKIKGSKLPIKMEHHFSSNDLRKMWHVANTRDKAILAVGCSLGREVSAMRDMKRDFYEKLVRRARSEEKDFIEFEDVRAKEDTVRLGILTPCSLDSLQRYLEKTKDSQSEWLWKNGNGGRLSPDAFNDILKALVKEANIETIGKIRWHLLRKWLMSRLTDSGMSEWQVKSVVGKSIPATDATYLHIKKATIEKYKEAYPKHLSLVAFSNGKLKIEEVKDTQDRILKALARILIKEMKGKIDMKDIQDIESASLKGAKLLGKIEQILDIQKETKEG